MSSHDDRNALPAIVIGAGPVGLAAAAHLLRHGVEPVVLEAGPAVGWSIGAWGHVRVFSPWKYMVDPVARGMLEASGWTMPDEDALPTGADFVARYLEPLASLPALAPHVRFGHRVVAVSRAGLDKVRSAGREEAPFSVVCSTHAGEVRLLARAVIDASGTYTSANPLGAGGLPARGEAAQRSRIHYGIPDVRGRDRDRYAGGRTLVVGAGHSAFNALLELAWLKTEAPETEIVWAIRRKAIGRLFGGGAEDQLPARGSLGSRLRKLVEIGVVEMVTDFHATDVTPRGETLDVRGGHTTIEGVDEVVVAAGFRPDIDMLREVRIALDPALECPVALAPLIDPNVHSCGTVYPHGYRELRHPEGDFFIVGMKSYGRAPTFLLLTGYEQVRSIAAALAGDMGAALSVELVLPETGVCSTDPEPDRGGGCCTSAQEPVEHAGAAVGAGTRAGAAGAPVDAGSRAGAAAGRDDADAGIAVAAAGAGAGGGCGCG